MKGTEILKDISIFQGVIEFDAPDGKRYKLQRLDGSLFVQTGTDWHHFASLVRIPSNAGPRWVWDKISELDVYG